MLAYYTREVDQSTLPIKPVVENQLAEWLSSQDLETREWVKNTGFTAKPDTTLLIPNAKGQLHAVLLGVNGMTAFLHYATLPKILPAGQYQIEKTDFDDQESYERALLAWGLGHYQFSAYRQKPPYQAKLLLPKQVNYQLLEDWITTIYLVRDLINTPTEDMGPAELAEAVVNVAGEFDADVKVIIGDELLEAGFSAIHAVGRAGSQAPRLIDLEWGNPSAPKITVVGKGVCFDSGGLNLKTADGMLLMKKDMGGAAHALGLARMIMLRELPVRLRLLIPAVENSVGSNSYRPGDVIRTRAGLTVEVTNTDAEGRLVVCDALAEAAVEDPDILFDFATLTGAARVALGPDLPALFCNQEGLGKALLSSSKMVCDPIWEMPLYQPYRNYLKSDIADLMNASLGNAAGSIVAALFLQSFVSNQIPWAHLDLFAWNIEEMPGRPKGGEVMGLRAVFHYLEKQFA